MSEKIRKSEDEWRAGLSEEAFRVSRQKGTERPFTGEYYDHHEDGVYLCTCCGNELFDSGDKFESGTGWPSFTRVMSGDDVVLETDVSHGMTRVEVLCGRCDAHLGHVFEDGPAPTGQRFCINSASLGFKNRS